MKYENVKRKNDETIYKIDRQTEKRRREIRRRRHVTRFFKNLLN